MEELPNDKSADSIVRNELKIAEIPVYADNAAFVQRQNVTLCGKLGPVTFRRTKKYWVATGFVAVSVAKEIYNTPEGKKNILIGGHKNCPEPVNPWLLWLTSDNKRIISYHDEKMYHNFVEAGIFNEGILSNIVFAEESQFNELGAAYVELYHILTQEALNTFARIIISNYSS